jgi:preprotein translocase SecF subunit
MGHEKGGIRMDIIKKKTIFFTVSAVIIAIGIASMLIMGVNQDIDFSGGTAIHVSIGQEFDNDEIRTIVTDTIGFEPSSIQKVEDGTQVMIRTTEIPSEKREEVFSALQKKYDLTQENLLSSQNFSPTVGNDLKKNAITASLLASFFMLIYISIRFDFKSGVAAVIALIHDLLIMFTVYVVFRIPLNTSFIAAMLTILGYSINNTIVIFDRVRENTKYLRKESFAGIVNKSIMETLPRTINTSFTTLITILTLYVLGVPSIRDFAFPLIIGILAGTYSSIFISGPIWALLRNDKSKSKKVKTA